MAGVVAPAPALLLDAPRERPASCIAMKCANEVPAPAAPGAAGSLENEAPRE
jgi:hypothetical protein